MATSTNESLSELERRSERTRAELAQTVDALHSRVSPAAIKADVKSYVRDNPLQAAAIAVGAAYPVWRLMGAIPAPVLLIGAGLAMARRNGTSTSGTTCSTGTVSSTLDSTREAASDTLHQVSDRASETYARASEQLSGMIERHPLLVGGVAFAVGSIVAAAVPVSRQESRLMGFVVAGILAMVGMNRLKAEALVPNRTINQLHRDAETMKEHI